MTDETSDDRGPLRRKGAVATYDFRRPNKFSRDHLRAIQMVADTYARQVSTLLATTVRTEAYARLDFVTQSTYDEFEMQLRNPSYLAVVEFNPLPGFAMLAIDPKVALAIVDRLVGGQGQAGEIRALTEIERGLMKNSTQHVVDEFSNAFTLTDITGTIVATESNPQFVQICAPSDMTVVITLDVKVAHEMGKIYLCITWDSLQEVLEAHEAKNNFSDRVGNEALHNREAIDHSLHDVPVDVAVRFRSIVLTSKEIINLQVGDVVSLHHPVNKPLVGLVDGVSCFTAITGRKGSKLACLVVDTTNGGKP